MKNLLIASAALLGVLTTPMLAAAQDDIIEEEVVTPKKSKDWFVYADANIAIAQFTRIDGDTTYSSDSTTAAFYRAGVKYKFVGAEVEIGQGLSDIDEDGISIGVSSQTSFFAMLRTPRKKMNAFLRAGYHASEIEVSGQVFNPNTFEQEFVKETLDANGFAVGVGGTFYFTDNFGLRADITGYNMNDLVEASFVTASIGGTARF